MSRYSGTVAINSTPVGVEKESLGLIELARGPGPWETFTLVVLPRALRREGQSQNKNPDSRPPLYKRDKAEGRTGTPATLNSSQAY